jgi:hypothetical protein
MWALLRFELNKVGMQNTAEASAVEVEPTASTASQYRDQNQSPYTFNRSSRICMLPSCEMDEYNLH